MKYIEAKTAPEDIETLLNKKLVELDRSVNDCKSGSILKLSELISDVEFYFNTGNISRITYENFIHEINLTAKEFTKRCACYKKAID